MTKKFIVRFFVFAAAAGVVLSAVCCVNYHFLKSIMQESHLKIDQMIDTIIIGDSHTQTSIDQTLIPHALNFSANSQHYLYSFALLNQLLAANGQIKSVVLGYSYHNLNEYYDKLLWDNDRARFQLSDYYGLLGPKEREIVRSRSAPYVLVFAKYHLGFPVRVHVPLYWKTFIGQRKIQDYPFYGKLYKSKVSNISSKSLDKVLQRHFYRSDKKTFQSDARYQKDYLNQIIELCRKQGVHIYLLITPLHRDYRDKIPLEFQSRFDQYTQELVRNNSHVTVWDFSKGLYPDFMYGDPDHLNYYGAQAFSRLLNRQLRDR